MPTDQDDMARVAHQVRTALEAADLSAFGDLLAPHVHWGAPDDPASSCTNRAQVLRWYRRRRDAGVRARMTDVEVHGDRLLVGLMVADQAASDGGGEAERWQVLTIGDGRVVDIVGFDTRDEAVAWAGPAREPTRPPADDVS